MRIPRCIIIDLNLRRSLTVGPGLWIEGHLQETAAYFSEIALARINEEIPRVRTNCGETLHDELNVAVADHVEILRRAGGVDPLWPKGKRARLRRHRDAGSRCAGQDY